MNPDLSGKVRPGHLTRLAYVYVRQSTLHQVTQNSESTRRQYGLRERAVVLGWPEASIEVIDCDLGQSGASTVDRLGFQRLTADVSLGRVGIVLGLEVSRLARNNSDWHRLLEICALTQTLILDEDGLYDPASFNDRLLLGLKGTMSEAELHLLRARLRGGLLAKAKRGELQIALPVGLVYDERGAVQRHPDIQVQESVRQLFDTFRRTGSAGATVKYFRQQSLLFPRPAIPGSHSLEVRWRPLGLSATVAALHNPRYAGAYAYGRLHTQKRVDGGCRTTRVAQEAWHTLLLDAHPGYITWLEFEQIRQQLHRTAVAYRMEDRRIAPREGPALLQGLALCGRCGHRMSVQYHDRHGTLVPTYHCTAEIRELKAPLCQTIPGASIDLAVGQLLMETMTPMTLDITFAVMAELQTRFDDADRLRQAQVQRAQQDADFARRRYMQVDPNNRLVAVTLEADWNEALRALDEVRQQAERQRISDGTTLDEAAKTQIRALAQDLPAAFADPSTAPRDRKRMAALILADVTLLKGDELTVQVRFRGGQTRTLNLPTPLNAWRRRATHPDTALRINQLLERGDETNVAEQLNQEGVRTGADLPFTADAVRWVCYGHAIPSYEARRRTEGRLTTAEMASLLGISESLTKGWARQGRLLGARSGRKSTWLLEPISGQPEDIRQRVATPRRPRRPPPSAAIAADLRNRIDRLLADHDDSEIAVLLNAAGVRTGSGAPFSREAVRYIRLSYHLKTRVDRHKLAGKLSTSAMARRLGIGLRTVEHWARRGKLRGTRHAPNRSWILESIADQPEEIQQIAAAQATVPLPSGHVPTRPTWRIAGSAAQGVV